MEKVVKKIKLESPVLLQLDDYDKDVPISKNDLVVVLNYLTKLACQVCFSIFSIY